MNDTNLFHLIRESERIAVLTGAGISAESGIPTFRGKEGFWKNHRPEELATPEGFHRDPLTVWEWYQMRRQKIAECRPNPAHLLLAQWEATKRIVIITQNVDGLHTTAGSTDVIELHGNIWEVKCTAEKKVWEDRTPTFPSLPPLCSCGAMLRPNVVWFGESLPPGAIERAFDESARADLCLVIGTSSLVQPAASIGFYALSHGTPVAEINPTPTPLTPHATHVLKMTAVHFAEEVQRHETQESS